VFMARSSIAAELLTSYGEKKRDLKARDGVPFDPRRAKIAANNEDSGNDDVDFHTRDTTARK
jgi:hypothetical protein